MDIFLPPPAELQFGSGEVGVPGLTFLAIDTAVLLGFDKQSSAQFFLHAESEKLAEEALEVQIPTQVLMPIG